MKHIQFFWKAFFFTLILLYLSLAPSETFPEVGILNFDKFVHFCIYFAQTTLFIAAFHKAKLFTYRANIFWGLGVGLLTGLSTELLQGTQWINRHADWLDMLANSMGAITAAATFRVFNNKWLKPIYRML